jgi:hypothetical protein
MLSADPRQGFTLSQILSQILLATFLEREFMVLQREQAEIEDSTRAKVEEAQRRKREFIALLDDGEREAVRRSFSPVLSDLPGTNVIPFSVEHTPTSYPTRQGIELLVTNC